MMQAWVRGLAAAVPSRCGVCGAWPAEAVCRACTVRFMPAQPRCGRCALPVPAGVATCGHCLREPPPLDACHAAVSYSYPWSGLIARFKFQGQPGQAATLAGLLRAATGVEEALAQSDLVLPMPLARARLAGRGFNQALEIARRLAPGRTDTLLLLRARETPPQASLSRRDRLANVHGAFAVDPLRAVAALRGRRVALVDDVMTSGASVFAAARALRDAGAAEVRALVVARTDE
ncbi:MAG: ComF family protein [Pseudomonadota bacterium]